MLLIYSHRTADTWTLGGATWAAGSDQLTSRNPADPAQLTWPGSGVNQVTLTAEFGDTVRIGGLALLATTLPVGVLVGVAGRRAADSDYTYSLSAARAVTALPGGGTGIVCSFTAADPVVGLQLTINDSAAAITDADAVAFGELILGPAVDVDIKTGWKPGNVDPSRRGRTLGSVPQRVQRKGYRTLTVTPDFVGHDGALAGGLAGGTDWETLQRTLCADPYVLAAPLTGAVADLHRTAIYGDVTRLPDMPSLSGPYYGLTQLTIEEAPG